MMAFDFNAADFADINLTSFLKWIVATRGDVGEPEFHASLLKPGFPHLLQAHKLTNRFQLRYAATESKSSDLALRKTLWASASYTRRRVIRHLEETVRILRELPAEDASIVVIKGFSVFAQTGAEKHLRFCSDIDLLSSEPLRVCKTLATLGYRNEIHLPWQHEAASARRDDVLVELHRFVPVPALPGGLRERLDPSHPMTILQTIASPPGGRVEFAQVFERTRHCRLPRMEIIRIPSREVTFFINAVHLLRHYIEPIVHNKLSLQMGDIADAWDLIQHPAFNKMELEKMVEMNGGWDAVQFLRSLFYILLETDPLPGFGETSPSSTLPPRQLSWFGGWVAAQDPHTLLLPVTLNNTFTHLRVTTIALSRAWSVYRFRRGAITPGANENSRQLAAIIVERGEATDISVSFAVSASSAQITFRVTLPCLPTTFYQINLYFDSTTFGQTVSFDEQGALHHPVGSAKIRLLANRNECQVEGCVPLSQKSQRNGEGIPVLLTIMRRATHANDRISDPPPDATAIFPIRLIN